jgi:DNA primase
LPTGFDRDVESQMVSLYDTDRRLAATNPRTAALLDRPGRLLVDYLRNGRGTTAVGAYSPRASPGFSGSHAVSWRDLDRGIRSDKLQDRAFFPAHSTQNRQRRLWISKGEQVTARKAKIRGSSTAHL